MSERPRLAIRLAYLGADFAGWQVQPGARTVQGELERALEKLYRQPVKVVGAGRTDAGVHAAGQVAHLDAPRAIPPAGLRAALNNVLPDDLRAMRVWSVPASFHARRSARAKCYAYRIAWGAPLAPWEALRTWLLPRRPDLEALTLLPPLLVGEHDFASFASSGHAGTGRRGTCRRLHRVELRRRGRRLALHVVGDAFLRGMVRRLVGAVVEVGRGAQPPAWVEALLASPATLPPAPTAPAHGLTLERVYYEPPRAAAQGSSPAAEGTSRSSKAQS